MELPASFLKNPIAHRGLHDASIGVPENSLAAFGLAIEAGYGIELDLQLSKDGVAMVFHDYDLARLTEEEGVVIETTSEAMCDIYLKGSDQKIPTLAEVLTFVAGRAPLLVEFKDQDGKLGANTGALEAAAAAEFANYQGDIAVMSYNPHVARHMRTLAPNIPRGLVTSGFRAENWPQLSDEFRADLALIPDFEDVDASFISQNAEDLHLPRVAELKAIGASILCWTIRSKAQEIAARDVADNITFEGYAAEISDGR